MCDLDTFIRKLEIIYKIDLKKLEEIKQLSLKKPSIPENFTINQLNKLKKTDIERFCKEQNLDIKGNKQILIQRLLGNIEETDIEIIERFNRYLLNEFEIDEEELRVLYKPYNFKELNKKSLKDIKKIYKLIKGKSPFSKKKKKDLINSILGKKVEKKTLPRNQSTLEMMIKNTTQVMSILEKLERDKIHIDVLRNEFNNFEHKETGFVFNPFNKKVKGVQLEDGTIRNLTNDEIEICKDYNFLVEF